MKFLTQETPAKVMSLLGVALASLAFLAAVTVTDSSFSGSRTHLADPFNATNMTEAVGAVADSYSNYITAVLINPGKADFALAADNVSWLMSNAKDGLVAMLNLQDAGQPSTVAQSQPTGEVAGAVTTQPYQPHQSSDIGLFSILGIE